MYVLSLITDIVRTAEGGRREYVLQLPRFVMATMRVAVAAAALSTGSMTRPAVKSERRCESHDEEISDGELKRQQMNTLRFENP